MGCVMMTCKQIAYTLRRLIERVVEQSTDLYKA